MLDDYEICDNLEHCLKQLARNAELAVAVSQEYFQNRNSIENIGIYCFENPNVIYDYALYFMVRKDFSYLKELNGFIGMASESGLINKWRSTGPTKTYVTEKEQAYNNVKIKNLFGIFVIFLLLQALIVLTITLERFVHKKVNGRNPSRFWIYADMIISPDRLFLLETVNLV